MAAQKEETLWTVVKCTGFREEGEPGCTSLMIKSVS